MHFGAFMHASFILVHAVWFMQFGSCSLVHAVWFMQFGSCILVAVWSVSGPILSIGILSYVAGGPVFSLLMVVLETYQVKALYETGQTGVIDMQRHHACSGQRNLSERLQADSTFRARSLGLNQ
jgi:hypothetical protein